MLHSLFPNTGPPASGDGFGNSVAVSGNIVVVGAPFDDTGATDAGSAYVFNATTGALVAKLNNPTPAILDSFGFSVAVSGDMVVVGAFRDDTGAVNSGSAYVFDGVTGALVTPLENPTPASNDGFGISVAVSGNTAVVGARGDDTGAQDAGSAYVFNATSGSLTATINNPTPASSDEFGVSVAVSGNLVVVGDTSNAGGSVYVFNATTGALVATLNNPTPATQDRFGFSVAVSGNAAIVGAFNEPSGIVGSAFLFNVTTGALVATLNNPTPANQDYFGYSVAVSGNIAVVGAYWDDAGGPDVGSACVFNATTGALLDTVSNPTPASNDLFGSSVAVSGDIVLIGAYQDGTQNPNQGAAYVYSIAAPRVQTVRVNDGSAQRSQVNSLTVAFDAPVSFAGTVAQAFTLSHDGGTPVIFTASSSVINGVTVVTLSNFTGAETQFGSLADGRYTLIAMASQISANGQPLDGNGDGLGGDNYTFGDAQGLYRFFGDANGDRHVDIADFALFSTTYGVHTGQSGFLAYFDYNNDGTIDIADFGQFAIRMFTTLP